MSLPQYSASAAARSPAPARRKRRRCIFAPADDQKLRDCTSRAELLNAISAIVRETNYSRRSVIRRAKKLGIWSKFARELPGERISIARLLSKHAMGEDPVTAIASRLHITKAAARLRIYRDEDCLQYLTDGTYSVRELAEGFCVRQLTISTWIRSGLLSARRLQPRGKLRISSDAIVEFVLAYPRLIPWDKCLAKSSWLRDVLEDTRYQQVAALLCVSAKTLRTWVERGMLRFQFDPENIGKLWSDGPVYRFLDEYPDLIDLPKCAAQNPEWFVHYAKVRGTYPTLAVPRLDRPRSTARHAQSISGRILLHRS
jgi:hypothetical protein